MVSDDKTLEVTSDLQRAENSVFPGNLDLNITASKDEGNINCDGKFICNDGNQKIEVHLARQEHLGFPPFTVDISDQARASPPQSELEDAHGLPCVERENKEPSSVVLAEFCHDNIVQRNVESGVGSLLSGDPAHKDNHFSRGLEAVGSGDYCSKPSTSLKGSTNDDEESDDVMLSAVADANGQGIMKLNDSIDVRSPNDGEEVYKYSDHFIRNQDIEKMDSKCGVENYHHGNQCNLSSDIVLQKEKFQHSDELLIEKENMEDVNLVSVSSERCHERPVSPVNMLVGSLDAYHSNQLPSSENLSVNNVQELSRSPNDVGESSHSPSQRQSPFPERPTMDYKGADSPPHLSPSAEAVSTSPRRGNKHVRQKERYSHDVSPSSPRRSRSPSRYRRRSRSASRSPIRRKLSPHRHGRDHRDRYRSRSPNARDHYKSPRRRNYPSGRSPRGYHSRHSPRRRPWSPPPNRSTGLGRPGKNLFIAGFSFVTTERDLERKFSRFGRVTSVRIVRDKRTGDSRGFGFLSLERDEDADAAIRALDQKEWNGRIVLVEKSKTSVR